MTMFVDFLAESCPISLHVSPSPQVFFRFHIVCFAGFFLLSCAHYSSCWLYFAPGLLLYAADLALRAGQLANTTTVTAANVEEHAAVATIQMKADKVRAAGRLGCEHVPTLCSASQVGLQHTECLNTSL